MKKTFPVYTTVSNDPKTICRDLDEKVFDYPFFNEGVTRMNAKSEKYELNELKFADKDNLLELKGFIFHTSHCGSTLLSRMLNEAPQIRVISETEAINGLLLSYLLCNLPKDKLFSRLKKIINAYRQPIGEEKYLIFKMSSWNIFTAELIQKLFPDTAWVYIDRNTEEVLQSLLKSSEGMVSWYYQSTDILTKHFIKEPKLIDSLQDYLYQLVKQHRKKADTYQNQFMYKLQYPDFLDELESKILPHFNIQLSKDEITEMCKLKAYYSKSWEKKAFHKPA